jgi:hypothetical protein
MTAGKRRREPHRQRLLAMAMPSGADHHLHLSPLRRRLLLHHHAGELIKLADICLQPIQQVTILIGLLNSYYF